MTWTGEERRGDNTSVRLALLEQAQTGTERRHEENKKSLIAVHVRITALGKDFEAALSKGLDAIIDKMDKQNALFNERSERITKLEYAQIWVERSLYGMGAFGVMVAGWIFNHSDKAR
jgi:thiamine biosynthesis lipoprotein ApbE